jgi:hypothetical protein
MTRSRRLNTPDVVPLREELEALFHHYQHLHNEHERTDPNSSTRRRIEERLQEVRERFDRALEEWVPDEELRNAWREHLHNRAPAPDGPPAIRPLVYRGYAEVTGSVVEIRGKGDELQVTVDGALVERIAGEKDFSVVGAPVRYKLNDVEFTETFEASPEAIAALEDFLDNEGSPSWEYSSELLADGLIDVHFALTPRGRRALGR